jgi:four helix bundle protein
MTTRPPDERPPDHLTNDHPTNLGGKMKLERFEDIEGWQEARVLAQMVYGVSSKGQFGRDFRLRRQIEDAAASVMANIAEGFDAGSDAEFIRFLGYARRSASEVQSHLYIALDRGYVTEQAFKPIYQKADQAKKLINGFIRYLRKSQTNAPDRRLPDQELSGHSTT